MGQEECPLSLTEEYRCLDRQRDNKQRNMPLLTNDNERTDQKNILGNGSDRTNEYRRRNEKI